MKNKITRRQFNNIALMSGAATALPAVVKANPQKAVRLGAPVFGEFDDPAEWARAHRELGYGGAYCPVKY